MKKLTFLLIIALCAAMLLACTDKEEESGTSTPAPVYKVTFVTGFDNIIIDPVYLDGSNEQTMPEDPFEAGYTFLGWFLDRECTEPFATTYGFTKDTVLYAGWREKTFSDGSGSGGIDPEPTIGSLQYAETDEGWYVTGYTGGMPVVTIPSEYDDLAVIGIRKGAFDGTMVEKIVLPASMSDVEEGAFIGARRLKTIETSSVCVAYKAENGVLYNRTMTALYCVPAKTEISVYNLPSTVKTIGAYAFYGCAKPVAFAADSPIRIIDEYVFAGFTGTFTVPSYITEIRKCAFNGSECVLTFASDSGLTALQNGAFDGYRGAKVIVPASVKTVSGGAFNGCSAAVDFSRSTLTAFGDEAFLGYAGEAIVVPAKVTLLGKNCFAKSTATVTFATGSTISTIGGYAFADYGGEATLPATVRTVSDYAFYHAGSTAKITFLGSKSGISIGENAFYLSTATVIYP